MVQAGSDKSAGRETPRQGVSHEQVRASALEHFDKWARSYDRSRLNELVFFPTIRMCLEEIARWQQGRGGGAYRLLDVGCGTGRLISILAADENAARLVGLDYSPVMVENVAAKIAESPFRDKLEAVEGDAEHLDFPDGAFDIVTCCNSFHHYPHQSAVIEGFFRVLKPGGLLILVDGFRDNVIGWLVFDVGVVFVEKDVYHVPWGEMKAMIEAAGFATLRQRKMNVLAPLLVNVALR